MTTRKLRTGLLLGATLLAGGTAAAIAQGSGGTGTFDPAQMPAVHGTVARYDLTPRGDVDGLILQDGTEAHFPPHLGLQVVALVHPGDAVTLHGLKARAIPLVQAMSVTADASGRTVVDEGPGNGHRPPPPGPHVGTALQAQGVVRMALHGPRGELNGAMLEDGTLLHLPPPEVQRLSAQLQPGQTVAVRGEGVDDALGRSIAVQAFGPSPDKLATVAAPPPREPRHPGDPQPDPAHGGPAVDDAAPPPP